MVLKRNLLCIVGTVIAAALFAIACFSSTKMASAADLRTVQVGCEVHETLQLDFFFPDNAHLHNFVGGKPATSGMTTHDLQQNSKTSCNTPEYLAEDWFPQIWHGPNEQVVTIRKVNVYYRGDEGATMAPIPDGARLLGGEQITNIEYMCGGNGAQKFDTINGIDGCTQEQFRFTIDLPDCWDGSGKQVNDFAFRQGASSCPTGFPNKLIEARFAIHYNTPPGGLQLPVKFSCDSGRCTVGDTEPGEMHGDIFFTVKGDPAAGPGGTGYYGLLADCGITAPISGAQPAKCRTGDAG